MNYRTHLPVIALCTSVIVDRLVTLQYFHLETNPIVSTLGPIAWLLVTSILLVVTPLVWFASGSDVWEFAPIRMWLYLTAIVHVLAVFSNLWVIGLV